MEKSSLDAAGFALRRVYPVGGDTMMVRNAGFLEAERVLGCDNRNTAIALQLR